MMNHLFFFFLASIEPGKILTPGHATGVERFPKSIVPFYASMFSDLQTHCAGKVGNFRQRKVAPWERHPALAASTSGAT